MIWTAHQFEAHPGVPGECRQCPFGETASLHRGGAAIVVEDDPAAVGAAAIRELQEAREMLGEGWLAGGVSLAEGIRRKVAALEDVLR